MCYWKRFDQQRLRNKGFSEEGLIERGSSTKDVQHLIFSLVPLQLGKVFGCTESGKYDGDPFVPKQEKNPIIHEFSEETDTTDDIALGVAVGSEGRGNLPGATSDIRAALLLLLIGKCTADANAFQEFGGEEFFRRLLDDTDSRVAYYTSAFLLMRMMTEEPEKYQCILQNLILRAQQSNSEKLLENPYLQIRGILQLSNDIGIGK